MDNRSLHHRGRLASAIQRCLSEMLTLEIEDPRIHGVTVRRVLLTGDLRIARIYYEVVPMTDDERQRMREALEKARGFFRRQMASRLSLRVVPELEFYDEAD